ncbi:hypothetical protein HTSR_0410 [Halodesulfurarchaeum formicicum]|uniref:Uncharacterized protein n=1 Tax=Halodesulfurarchaeum formicicum TaxID=1873524 RepID=A0A1D8S2M9_9EURY|nr:hypothetical protein HTSR_0410 [Halodesulfurarchaeum formicicum]
MAFDVDRVEARVPGRTDVGVRVAGHHTPGRLGIDPHVVHRDLNRRWVGLPAQFRGTGDDGVEPVGDVQVRHDRISEERLGVGHHADRHVEVGDERGVLVEVGGFGPLLGVLDGVERLPELDRLESQILEVGITGAEQTVPERPGLAVGERIAQLLADGIKDLASVGPLGVDDRAIEIE